MGFNSGFKGLRKFTNAQQQDVHIAYTSFNQIGHEFNCAYKQRKVITASIFRNLAITQFVWTFLAKFYPNPSNSVESGANFL